MKKVREIITIKGWVDGSGWTFSQCYSDQIINVSDDTLKSGATMDWDWWEKNELAEGEDTEITVSYYSVDADPTVDAPLAEWCIWESEI